MTLTASRPAEPEAAQPPEVSEVAAVVPESLLTTSDHKRLGRAYLAAAVLFVLVGAVVGVVLELELSAKGVSVVGPNYGRLYNLHSTVTTLLFLTPLWIGLGTYLVPLQIGARRLAFPRVQALAFWSFVAGGALLLCSYAFGTPNGMGIAVSTPLEPLKGVSRATDLWAAALVLITVSTVLASANLFVTVLKLRADGMTMVRIPAFSWSIFAVSAATVLSAPIFVAGMLIVYLDQHFGGGVFAAHQTNGNLVWQHLVWLYGRPDVYLVIVPALGALTDVVATHARRPMLQPVLAKAIIFFTAVLCFGVLAANANVERAVVQPAPTLLTALIVVPLGLMALLWLGTVRPAELRLHVSLLYLAGFLLLLVAGAVNAAVAPSQHLVGGLSGSEWTVGQVHAVLIGAPTLAAFAAIYHWSPKIWGRGLNQLLGVVQFLLLFGGLVITAAGAWGAGYDGAPWHVDDYVGARADHWFNYAKLASAGGVLVALGLLVFLANVVVTWNSARQAPAEDRPADPYEGSTLEWATSSPPPEENFDVLPEIRSDSPLADLRAGAGAEV